MPKKLLEDMVKVKKKRLEPINEVDRPKPKEFNTKRNRRRPRFTLWFIATISVVFFLFALSYLFSKATVTVNPKMKDVVLNENLSGSKDASGDVPFNVVVISGQENKTVQATGQKELSIKATGTVMIYNSFSSSSQLLSIDTRLEGSNGKIYKTQTKTVVPGMNKDGTPGGVEVGIYADVAGQESNSSPLDFKIFGFKGTPKYAKFYARSKGDITGGFTGNSSFISDADKTAAIDELKTTLQADLLKKATNQIPNGFILFKDATYLSIDSGDIPPTASSTLSVNVSGTLYGFLFNESKLTDKIVKDTIPDYDGSPVYMPNIRDLTFSIPATLDMSSFGDLKNINFNLSGTAKIVWKIDTNKLVADLLGKEKKNFNQILAQYPNIDSASLVLSPFWKSSIPDKAKAVNVIVNYPQ